MQLKKTWHIVTYPLNLAINKNIPVAQMVEHDASNAKIMGLIPRESKSWSNVKL